MTRQNLPDINLPGVFPSFQKEMNRLMDQFRTGFPFPDMAGAPAMGAAGYPAIDVVEKDDALEISAELPGVNETDLDVTVQGDVLMLRGEKTSEHAESGDGYQRMERQYGSFRRQIPLGFTPDAGAVTAEFDNGVLTMRVAKPASAVRDAQRIEIARK